MRVCPQFSFFLRLATCTESLPASLAFLFLIIFLALWIISAASSALLTPAIFLWVIHTPLSRGWFLVRSYIAALIQQWPTLWKFYPHKGHSGYSKAPWKIFINFCFSSLVMASSWREIFKSASTFIAKTLNASTFASFSSCFLRFAALSPRLKVIPEVIWGCYVGTNSLWSFLGLGLVLETP